MMSGLNNRNLNTLWEKIQEHRRILTASGELDTKRREQHKTWMWAMLKERLLHAFETHPQVAALIPQMEQAVQGGTLTPTVAAERLLGAFGLDALTV